MSIKVKKNLTRGITSKYYVQMKLREERDEASPVRILSDKRCGHRETVCPRCLPEWECDYEVFFERTIGGRKLLESKI